MSELFDNYKHDNRTVPNNERVFIKKPKEFKDVIVLGGTNGHTFSIPYAKDEIVDFSITYVQGTETVLTKYFDCSLFAEEQKEDNITHYFYTGISPDYGSKLIEVVREDLDELIEDEDDELNLAIAFCSIFYNISPEESLLFNDWNSEVYVQLKAHIDIEHDGTTVTEFSRKYRIKIVNTLQQKEQEENW